MPKITVIMPSLNVERYIGKCLESVVTQSFQDIEILVIDAGSTDGTRDIIRSYESEDKRVRVIYSDKRSYGYQVNMGIAMARGKYLSIIETDDYIDRDMFSELYNKAEEYGLDYIKADNYNFVQLDSGDIWKVRFSSCNPQIYDKVINPSEHRELHMRDIFIWKGLYNTNFLKKYCIRLNESEGAAFQDAGFLFQTLGQAKRVMYLDKVFYYYRQDNSSSSIYNRKGFHYLVDEYRFIYEKLGRKEIWQEIEPYYYCRLFMQVNGRIRTMAASGEVWVEAEDDIAKLRLILLEASNRHLFDEYILDVAVWTDLQMFLYDSLKYIQMQMNLYEMKREKLHYLYQKISKYDNVIFYSCSNVGKFVNCLLDKQQMKKHIIFCDNNREKQAEAFAGKKVYSVEEAVSLFKNAVYIIANNHYLEEMRRQLLDMGVESQDIVQYRLGCDTLSLYL